MTASLRDVVSQTGASTDQLRLILRKAGMVTLAKPVLRRSFEGNDDDRRSAARSSQDDE